MRKWNRLLALLTAMVMTFSLAATAFADDDDSDDDDRRGEATQVNGNQDDSDRDDQDDDDTDDDDSDDTDDDSDDDDSDDIDDDSDDDDSGDTDDDSDDDDGDDIDDDSDDDDSGDTDDDSDDDDSDDTDDDSDDDDGDDKDDDDDDDDDDKDDDDDDDKTSSTIPAAADYSDVSESNWFYEAVSFATENNLIDGKDATTFAPGEDMTRQMLAVALYRLAGSPQVTAENPFTDVPDDAAYKDAVVWAYTNGIVNGETETTFNPDSSIQRQAIATMLARYTGADTTQGSDLSAFTDADAIQSYAKDAMSWAVANELIQGNPDGTIDPRGNTTRAQASAILQRFAAGTAQSDTTQN